MNENPVESVNHEVKHVRFEALILKTEAVNSSKHRYLCTKLIYTASNLRRHNLRKMKEFTFYFPIHVVL
jgi:hypothetical protein